MSLFAIHLCNSPERFILHMQMYFGITKVQDNPFNKVNK
jgi:hypothetical protein